MRHCESSLGVICLKYNFIRKTQNFVRVSAHQEQGSAYYWAYRKINLMNLKLYNWIIHVDVSMLEWSLVGCVPEYALCMLVLSVLPQPENCSSANVGLQYQTENAHLVAFRPFLTMLARGEASIPPACSTNRRRFAVRFAAVKILLDEVRARCCQIYAEPKI